MFAQSVRESLAGMLILVVLPSTVWSQEATGNVRYTLDQTVAAAIHNAPALQAARAAVARERSMLFQVTRKPNPIFGYVGTEVGNDGDAGQQGVFLYQDIVTANKLDLNGSVQRREIYIQCQQLNILQLQTILRTHLVYLDVVFFESRGFLLERLQQSLTEAIEAIEQLYKAGEVGKAPLLQAKLEAGRNEILIGQNAIQTAAARRALAGILGWDQFLVDVETDEMSIKLPPPDSEESWSWIAGQSPELALIAAQHDKTLWQVQRQLVEPIPDIQTQWSVQQDTSTNSTIAGIQIGIELPIHDRNRGAISAARADTRRTHHELDAMRRELRRRLAITLGQYSVAWQQLESLEGELSELAQQNLAVAREAFTAGESSYIDLLIAQRSFISLNQEILSQQFELAKAKAKLDAVLIDLPQ